jgi:hypothetical protein
MSKEVKAEYVDLSTLPGFPMDSACMRLADHALDEQRFNYFKENFGLNKLTDLEVSNKIFGQLQDYYKTNIIRVYILDRVTRFCNVLDQELGSIKRIGDAKLTKKLALSDEIEFECTNFPKELAHQFFILCRYGQVIS